MSPTSTPAHPTPSLAGRDASPARACGRRSRHTRRYVTTLIHLARAMDVGAMDRLQTHARRHARGEALGLGALAQTLMAPVRRRPGEPG